MQESMLHLIKQLIRIPSVTSDQNACKQVLDVIAAMFVDIPHARVEFFQDAGMHSLIVKNFDGKRADVCLNAHVDVVPPQDPSQFEPYEQDGLLYGRGAGDMKDGVALISVLMQECLENHIDTKLMLMLTADEEIG